MPWRWNRLDARHLCSNHSGAGGSPHQLRRSCPTIGIAAGAACDGQVLVWHDLLGLSDGNVAAFVKRYAALGDDILSALHITFSDVRGSRFPKPLTLTTCQHRAGTLSEKPVQ